MSSRNHTITYKVSRQQLENYGWLEVCYDENKEIGLNLVLDLIKANNNTYDEPEFTYAGDILISDWFEKPLEPTETELSLFQLEYGFIIEFID